MARAAATSSMIPAKGMMWDPFWGHSGKQFLPMCQRLQNAAPPAMGKETFQNTPCVFSPGRRRRR